jgi:hypothetical protein
LVEEIRLRDYSVLLEESVVPECDNQTVKAFADRMYDDPVTRHYVLESRFFSSPDCVLMLDVLQGEEPTLIWPLNCWVSNPRLPFSFTKPLLDVLPSLYTKLSDKFFSKPPFFSTYTVPATVESGTENYFGWVHSPVSNRYSDWEVWLRSLTKKRRWKVQNAYQSLEVVPGCSECFLGPPEERDINWLFDNLKLKYSEDPAYAASQVHWALTLGKKCYWLRYEHKGVLTALACFPAVGDRLTYQFIVKDESKVLNNLGTVVLAELMWHLHKMPTEFLLLDPNCQQGVFENDYDVYKRTIVNQSNTFPTLCLFRSWPYPDESPYPPYWSEKEGWNTEQTVFGTPI